MSAWDEYPENYRGREVQQIVRAVCAGECAAIIGLSGSGKSNLVGFLANRVRLPEGCGRFALVDCNRLAVPGLGGFYRLLLKGLAGAQFGAPLAHIPAAGSADETLEALETRLEQVIDSGSRVCFLLDRFDALYSLGSFSEIANSLRALRDAFKYRLTLVIAARRPPPADNELAELFFGRTLWLGPLAHSDALWSARRDSQRYTAGGEWDSAVLERLAALSGGYPALLRAACEAYSQGAALEDAALRSHPAVQQRVAEFWADDPPAEALERTGLAGLPWLESQPQAPSDEPRFDETQLTAKESRLLEYLRAHAGEVCEKDDLVRAVWPEDVIYTQGIRDESLAQLIRRLRVKIEPDPRQPKHIQTAPGRGYIYRD
jgi:hypothetical protein